MKENSIIECTTVIEKESRKLLEVAETTRIEMNDYYPRLLDDECTEDAREKADSLKRATSNITKALTQTYVISDELNARLKDINKQKKGERLHISAPVLGHVFSLFYRLRGGKGIATTFGCLSGLLPYWQPVAVLAGFFVFFSLVLRITPHFHRTLMAYFAALISMAFIISPPALTVGFAIITAAVSIRMFASTEEREKMKVKLLWMC